MWISFLAVMQCPAPHSSKRKKFLLLRNMNAGSEISQVIFMDVFIHKRKLQTNVQKLNESKRTPILVHGEKGKRKNTQRLNWNNKYCAKPRIFRIILANRHRHRKMRHNKSNKKNNVPTHVQEQGTTDIFLATAPLFQIKIPTSKTILFSSVLCFAILWSKKRFA